MSALLDASGYEASFKHAPLKEGGKPYYESDDLLYWHETEDGNVWGVILNDGKLKNAESLNNFVGYRPNGKPMVIPALPGWWCVYRESKEPANGWWVRILAWQITEGGWTVKAILYPTPGGDGEPIEVSETAQFTYSATRENGGDGPWPFGEVTE